MAHLWMKVSVRQTPVLLGHPTPRIPFRLILEYTWTRYLLRSFDGKRRANLNASRLTAHIGFWMRLVSNHVSHAFARKLEASGVTVAEWVVLREMHGGDETTLPSAVAELTGLTRGAVSKLISRLLAKGLVTRNESASDRRYQDIELTKAGLAMIPQLAKLADENDEEFFGVLSRSGRKKLTGLLKKTAALHHLTQSLSPLGAANGCETQPDCFKYRCCGNVSGVCFAVCVSNSQAAWSCRHNAGSLPSSF
ncbi:MAG TPA: MarR family winged helix-turn-helix transcriptional regulator [Terriglobia bacterium]|nr:MarR family winged helix-turn-helix transcriptional regulator [Terriglobia bacterium]